MKNRRFVLVGSLLLVLLNIGALLFLVNPSDKDSSIPIERGQYIFVCIHPDTSLEQQGPRSATDFYALTPRDYDAAILWGDTWYIRDLISALEEELRTRDLFLDGLILEPTGHFAWKDQSNKLFQVFIGQSGGILTATLDGESHGVHLSNDMLRELSSLLPFYLEVEFSRILLEQEKALGAEPFTQNKASHSSPDRAESK